MIKKLQENLKQWEFLTPEEQAVYKKAERKNCANILFLDSKNGMWDIKVSCIGFFSDTDIYQLAPDYQPEPEIIDCPVLYGDIDEPVKFRHYDGNPLRLHKAYSCRGFRGFKFADGRVLPYPIKFSGAGIQTVLGQRDGEVEHCTHIRLRRLK